MFEIFKSNIQKYFNRVQTSNVDEDIKQRSFASLFAFHPSVFDCDVFVTYWWW